MSTTEEKLHAKIPGEDTGIITRNSFCDVCAPGPHCGVTCYVKDGKIIKVEGTDGHPTNHGLLCPKGQSNRTMAPAPWPSTPATTSGTAPFSSGCAMTSAP